ncbi:lipoprotein-releasing ABC transporter permease subunit [Aestuariibacter salexigens]|uniref:lipoprotein-releasing ABC transporter permease subunit n=1 Tax=Aestuariibacter salexigens TaxID=226010 RepID=UPI0003F4B95F|nr:lipoprotein-releasing ABC transporter permease subunit [Aestuariibacter salexigens]
MNLRWQLALRLRQQRGSSRFVGFVSGSSTFGIGLGCFVLILLLSVMNGFERELKDRLLAVIPHGELFSVSPAGIEDWSSYVEAFQQDTRIRYVQPYIETTAMLQQATSMKPVNVTAIDAKRLKDAGNALGSTLSNESVLRFQQTPNSVILGSGVMDKLGVEMGDSVQLLLPQVREDLKFTAPQTVWVNVVGEMRIGGELDNHSALMHISDAAELLGISHGAAGLRFQYHDPFIARELTRELGYGFDQYVYISDWKRTQGHLYQDIQLVRTVVYIALTLVIAVACFNIVSSLVMSVKDKEAQIAILKTMGAQPPLIRDVFIIQGALNGVVGTLIGVALGTLTALYLTDIVLFAETILGVHLLSGDIYFIDFLPSQLRITDVLFTAVIALLLSMLSTLYPAIRASKLNPASVLG